MAAVLKEYGGGYVRVTDASAANTALTLSALLGVAFRLVAVLVKYSAAPTQAGVSTVLNSGVGAAYDTTLNTGSANAQNTVFIPTNDLVVAEDDAIDVTAPAGGAGITSQITILARKL